MNRHNINTFIVDLDGTLFNNGTLELKDKRNITALQKWRLKGNYLWIATGRGYDIRQKLITMGLQPETIICSGGAGYAVDGQKPVYNYSINKQLLKELFSFLKKNFPQMDYLIDAVGAEHFYAYTGGGLMMSRLHLHEEVRDSLFFLNDSGDALRLFCVGPDEDYMYRAIQVIDDTFAGRLHCLHTDHNSIDILNASCSKGNEVHIVQNLMNISPRQCAVIGDEMTDVSMIPYCACSFAMKDGSEDIREKADYVIPSVADAVEFLLEGD